MDQQLDLLQGTLDMLILKAVSLGPLHGYGVLLRIQQISKARLEIQQGSLYPRSTAASTKAGSPVNGANRKTSGRRNITASRLLESAGSKPKPKSGTAWPTSSRQSWARNRSKYEVRQSLPFLANRDAAPLSP